MNFHVPAEPGVTNQTFYRNGPEATSEIWATTEVQLTAVKTWAPPQGNAGTHRMLHLFPPAAPQPLPSPGWYLMGAHHHLAQV